MADSKLIRPSLWDDCELEERYPGLSGRLLQDAIRADYVICENTALAFYKPGSNKKKEDQLIARHVLNPRDQHSTRQRYKNEIKKRGIIKGARSEIVCVPDAYIQLDMLKQPGCILAIQGQLVGGAHLCEAAYEAYEEEGEYNEQVQRTIEGGLPGVTIIDPRTPKPVLKEFVGIGNILNGVASVMELTN